MQEKSSQNQGINENMTVTSVMNQKNTNPILYILAGFGVAVVAFGLGFMVRGYSVNEYMTQETMTPEPIVQEEKVVTLTVMQDESVEVNLPSKIAESEDYVYTDEQLGFSLTLPPKYSVLEAEFKIFEGDLEVVWFSLPISSEGSHASQDIFAITKVLKNGDKSFLNYGPQSKLVGTNHNGDEYYFGTSMDRVIDVNDPAYELFLSLTDQELIPSVKNGFKLL